MGTTSMMIALGMSLLGALAAHAGESPANVAKPLSEIIKSVEDQNLGVITEAKYVGRSWKVEVHKGGKEVTLYLDSATGRKERQTIDTDIHEEFPPMDGRPLSEVIKSVEDQKLGAITEVEFDDGFWDMKLHRDGKKFRLKVRPKPGEKPTE